MCTVSFGSNFHSVVHDDTVFIKHGPSVASALWKPFAMIFHLFGASCATYGAPFAAMMETISFFIFFSP